MSKLFRAAITTFTALALLWAFDVRALGRIQGYAERGGSNALTNQAEPPIKVQRTCPGATATVYAGYTGSTLATLYSDTSFTAKSNPLTVNSSTGFYDFYTNHSAIRIAFSGCGMSWERAFPVIHDILPSSVRVWEYATGGLGTVASPWTGWDTAISWAADVDYDFGDDAYRLVSSPAGWVNNRLRLRCVGCRLYFTGSGNAFQIYGDSPLQGGMISGLTIIGNASTTNCMALRYFDGAHIENIRVANCTNAGLYLDRIVGLTVTRLRHSINDNLSTVYPNYGVYIEETAGSITTTVRFFDPKIDTVWGDAFYFGARTTTVAIYGGLVEQVGRAVHMTVFSSTCKIDSMHSENNGFEGTITSSGATATMTTVAPHGLVTGDKIDVAGATQANYNVVDTAVTVVNATRFTYTCVASANCGASPATTSTSIRAKVEDYLIDGGRNTVDHAFGEFGFRVGPNAAGINIENSFAGNSNRGIVVDAGALATTITSSTAQVIVNSGTNTMAERNRAVSGASLVDIRPFENFTGVLFASLSADVNGTIRYCSDCTIASPCASGGTGAFAKRLNGAWVCN